MSVFYDERIVVVAEQRPDASEEDSFQWMSRVLQVSRAAPGRGGDCRPPACLPAACLPGSLSLKIMFAPGMVAHWAAEAGGSLCFQSQPGLQN